MGGTHYAPNSMLTAVVARTGEPVANRVQAARGPIGRLRGLLGRDGLPLGSALLIDPCNGVHTAGMRFAIDLLFLDRAGRVVRMAHEVPPWRFIPFVRRASRVLELPAGTLVAAEVEVGDVVSIDAVGPRS